MDPVVYIDTETTGLDAERHQIWEIGLIDAEGEAHQWFLNVDLGRADPIALKIGGYHERHPHGYDHKHDDWEYISEPEDACEEVAKYTRGLPLVGANPSFDEQRLRRLMMLHDACPEWHYRPICVEALAVGYLASVQDVPLAVPWKSDDISKALGIDPESFGRHTALGDCAWAKAIYERVMKR